MYCNQKPENWIEYEMDLDPPLIKNNHNNTTTKKPQTKQIKKSKNEKENLRKSKKETKKIN